VFRTYLQDLDDAPDRLKLKVFGTYKGLNIREKKGEKREREPKDAPDRLKIESLWNLQRLDH